jgi:BASS family bile acid:Na+ symporter
MSLLPALSAALAWVGRQGTRAVAASVFAGLLLPPLAALLKPAVPTAIVALLALAFLRVDAGALRAQLARPALTLAAAVWIMLAVPALIGTALALLGIGEVLPAVHLALLLQAFAPPIMAAPAFAALLGLDAALVLATLMLCMAATPLTSIAFAAIFLAAPGALSGEPGAALTFSPLTLGIRIAAVLAGAALAAAVIRRTMGEPWLRRQRERIDGLNVIVLLIFAIAVMDGVTARLIVQPGLVIGLTLVAFALALAIAALTALVFARAGRRRALALGLATGLRNLGLMLAATGGAVPEVTWIYVGLAQFPIYLLPQLLQPLARRLPVERDEEP